MPFRPVSPEKLSSAVVRQVEELILRGILLPGKRLPPERELAERLGVSRPSLRDAIAQLQNADLLITKASAGVFVADVLGSAFSPALTALFARHDEAALDYLSFRRDMEGLAAERAARLGSDTDLAVISATFARMEAAQDSNSAEDDAVLDAQFHMSIIEASHNVVMLHMMRSMYDLLRSGVFYNRQMMFKQQTNRSELLNQHRAIVDALLIRDAGGARAAVEAHLNYVERALLDQQRAERHENVAQQRLDHEMRG
jgi:GntR family transcriptional repressor for pyruvate dehydrogenase complex